MLSVNENPSKCKEWQSNATLVPSAITPGRRKEPLDLGAAR